MAANPILTKWRAGEPTLGGWMVTDDPQVAEFMAQAGFDEICVDQQHGLADQSTISSLFRAIELHGVAPTTRVPANDAAAIGKSLDLGALAIVVPMVNNADEAADAAAACHYPPRGRRSVGPIRGVQARSSHRLEGLDDVACVVMVETTEGIRNVDAIAATPGVDCIYIGPGDLAIGLGLSAWNLDACRRHGVVPGIHTGAGATANRYLQQGFQMITVANDLGLLRFGGALELSIARGEREPSAQLTPS
jgi:4-hydroxy-2-oxoheptanedioate aldolase